MQTHANCYQWIRTGRNKNADDTCLLMCRFNRKLRGHIIMSVFLLMSIAVKREVKICSSPVTRLNDVTGLHYMHSTSYVQHKQLHMLEHLTSDWKQMAPWEQSPVYALETTPSISINRIMCKQASRSSLIERLASYSLTLQRLPALAADVSPREWPCLVSKGGGSRAP